MVGLLAPVVAVTGHVALQDFGEWTYQGTVAGRGLRGEEMGVAVFKDHPVPYTVSPLLLGLYGAVLSPLLAGAAAIATLVAAGSCAVVAVVRARGLAWRTALPLLATLVVAGSGFWNGYAAHQWGLAFFALSLALPARARSTTWAVALFGVLTFASHALVFAAYAFTVAVRALAERRIGAAAVGLAPSVGLAVWYAARSPVDGVGGGVESGSALRVLAYKAYTVAKSGGYQNLEVDGVSDGRLLMYAGAAANLALAVLLGVLALGALARVRRTTWREHADLLAAAGLLGIGLALPAFALGVVNPGERIIAPGLVLLVVAVCELEVLPRVRTAAASAALAGLALTAVSSWGLWHKAADGDPTPQDPQPTFGTDAGSRLETLFVHRLDQMESRFDAADRVWRDDAEPTEPLLFDEGLLRPTAPSP